eukprot:7355755-Lingulodinium_polyedra.AAC.1
MEGLGRGRAPGAFPPVVLAAVNFISVGANLWAPTVAEIASVVREGTAQAGALLAERERALAAG